MNKLIIPHLITVQWGAGITLLLTELCGLNAHCCHL